MSDIFAAADEFAAELDRRIASQDGRANLLRAELTAIEDEVTRLKVVRDSVANLCSGPIMGTNRTDVAKLGDASLLVPKNDKYASRGKSRPSRTDLIAQVLSESARPLSVAELREPLRAKGYGIGMEDHIMYNSIYTALKKWSSRFRKVEGDNAWELIPRPSFFDDDDSIDDKLPPVNPLPHSIPKSSEGSR